MQTERIIEKQQIRFLKHFLVLFVLSELEKRPMSGYNVIDLVHKHFKIKLSPSTTYTLLYRLEGENLVTIEWRGRKRFFTLTEKGKDTLRLVETEIDELQNFLCRSVRKQSFPRR